MDEIPENQEEDQDSTGQIFDIFKSPANYQPKTHSRRTPKRKLPDDSENRLRPRTPSGQVLSNSISDIKANLEKQAENWKVKEKIKQQSETSVKACDPTANWSSRACVSATADKALKTSQVCQPKHLEVNNRSNMINQSNIAEVLFKDTANPEMLEQQLKDIQTASYINESEGEERYMETDIDSARPNHTTMDIRTVVQMLEGLKIDMKEQLKNEVQNCLHSADENEMATTDKEKLKLLESKCSNLVKQVTVCQAKERMMVNIMSNMSQKIKELQAKNEMTDRTIGRRTVILSGFEGNQTKKAEYRQQLLHFFTNEMKIQIVIEDFYFIGSKTPQDVVLILLSSTHKKTIFQKYRQH